MHVRPSHLLIVLLVTVCLGSAASAAGNQVSAEAADALFQAEHWQEAAAAYRAIVEENAEDGQAWFRLGYALHRLEHDTEALAAYEKAQANGVNSIRLLASAAVSHENLGDRDAAMKRLAEAVELGMPSTLLRTTPSLAFAVDDPRFEALAARADELSFPCRNDPMARQFDFWIGEWNVTSGGPGIASSTITSRHEGCVIFESYTTNTGYSGESFNFYDPAIGKWRQIWVDSGGNVIWYEGGWSDGAMRLQGESFQRNANPVKSLSRMTFTPTENGSVRQLMEQSTDDGETWSVAFNGLYEKRAPVQD